MSGFWIFIVVASTVMAIAGWFAMFTPHIKHRWQGGEIERTPIYAGASRPNLIVYHQWFKCSECGREKLKKIGVKK